jgi:hypothetical protein
MKALLQAGFHGRAPVPLEMRYFGSGTVKVEGEMVNV